MAADLICISFIPPVGNADARRCVKMLAGLYRPEAPYALALGGGVLHGGELEAGAWPFKAFKVHQGSESFLRWANAKAAPAQRPATGRLPGTKAPEAPVTSRSSSH